MGQNSCRMRGYTVNGDANIEMTLPFVKQHCLRTRRLLDMTVGHNRQCKMHCSGRWFPQ